MNLRTIPHLAESFGCPVGLSDHTLGIAVPITAVALGACIVEKHFTLSRSQPGPDSAFSLEPHEFQAMVEAIRITEKALGQNQLPTDRKRTCQPNLPPLAVRRPEHRERRTLTTANIRSIRPGHGLAVTPSSGNSGS